MVSLLRNIGKFHVRLTSVQRDVRVFTVNQGKLRANSISRALRVGNLDMGDRKHHPEWMNELLVGYPRVSTEQQGLTVQRRGLRVLSVGDDHLGGSVGGLHFKCEE